MVGLERGFLKNPQLNHFVAEEIEKIFSLHEVRAGENVLDIGCGNGEILKILGRRHPHLHFLGVDIVDQFNHRDLPPNVSFRRIAPAALPLLGGNFALGYSYGVVQYFRESDLRGFVRDLPLILKERGSFLLGEVPVGPRYFNPHIFALPRNFLFKGALLLYMNFLYRYSVHDFSAHEELYDHFGYQYTYFPQDPRLPFAARVKHILLAKAQ